MRICPYISQLQIYKAWPSMAETECILFPSFDYDKLGSVGGRINALLRRAKDFALKILDFI